MYGVTGRPVSCAEWRVWTRAVSAPSEIHEVGPSGSPLSNTDENPLDSWATTKGQQRRKGAAGSLRRVSATSVSRSPTRVPPPGWLNTVRPSWASRAPADQYRSIIRSATALGGRIVW